MGFWTRINKLFDFAGGQTGICLVFLGLGLCRACLGWMLSLVRMAEQIGNLPFTAHQIVDLGEVLGFAVVALMSTRRSPVVSETPCLPLACASLLAGLAGMGAGSTLGCAPLLYASGLFAGTGYGALFLLWMELYGCLTAKSMTFAYAASYLVSVVAWLTMTGAEGTAGAVVACLGALACGVSLVSAHRRLAAGSPAGSPASPSSLAGSSSPAGPREAASFSGVSAWLIVWLGVFAFGYGLGDSITATGYATLVSKLGMAVPAALVVAAVLFMRSFDLTVLYRISSVFMLAGLAIAFFVSGAPTVSQVLMSAANEAYCLLGMVVACSSCHRTGRNAALYCGMVSLATLVFTQVGEVMGTALLPMGSRFALDVVALAAVALATVFLFQERHFSEQISLRDVGKTTTEEDLLALARERGLSAREQGVFLLMVRGESTAAIGEGLFISPSAVRSHATNIYRKFGVHSRQEFDELMASGQWL